MFISRRHYHFWPNSEQARYPFTLRQVAGLVFRQMRESVTLCTNGNIEDEVNFLCVGPEYESYRIVLYESDMGLIKAPV